MTNEDKKELKHLIKSISYYEHLQKETSDRLEYFKERKEKLEQRTKGYNKPTKIRRWVSGYYTTDQINNGDNNK